VLNQSSPVYTGGMNQLPVRTNVSIPIKVTNNLIYKYEGNKSDSQYQTKQVNKATENQKNQTNYETSGTRLNRRNAPMTFKNNRNMNLDVKNTNERTSAIRSKSSMKPNCDFLKDFIKQGENITEKIYPGKNNKLVVETRKVEVFRNSKTKSVGKIELRKAGENITEKIYPGKNNKLISETRKVEVFKIQKENAPHDNKLYQTETGKEYALRVQKNQKYINKEQEKETIYNERRRANKKIQIANQRTKGKYFKEEDGISKSYIKEKMIEIWLDESSKQFENSFSLIAEETQNKFSTRDSRPTYTSPRYTGLESKEEINYLVKAIKEKDSELNKIVNQLKAEINKNQIQTQTRTLIQKGTSTPRLQITNSRNTYSSNTTINKSSLEIMIQQLLSKIKEKDDQLNSLMNKIRLQQNIYNEYEQRTNSKSRYSGNQRERSSESNKRTNINNKTYIKNVYDSINRTVNTEEYDTLNTQNTINAEYDTKITQLENVIKEKDTEIEQLLSELNELKENPKKPEFNDLIFEQCYGLGIYSDNQPWINTVKLCPINTLSIVDKNNWNEINEISQLDLSILNIAKNWDDEVVEEGVNGIFVSGEEKDALEHQKINLLQINGHPILEKWLDEIQPDNNIDKVTIEKKTKRRKYHRTK
jgi:hypothetical protein